MGTKAKGAALGTSLIAASAFVATLIAGAGNIVEGAGKLYDFWQTRVAGGSKSGGSTSGSPGLSPRPAPLTTTSGTAPPSSTESPPPRMVSTTAAIEPLACLNAHGPEKILGPVGVTFAKCAIVAQAFDRTRDGTQLRGWIRNVSDKPVGFATVSDYYLSALGNEHHIGSWSAVTNRGLGCVAKDAGNTGLHTAGTGYFLRENDLRQKLPAEAERPIGIGETVSFVVMLYCAGDVKPGDTLDVDAKFYIQQSPPTWKSFSYTAEGVRILPKAGAVAVQ